MKKTLLLIFFLQIGSSFGQLDLSTAPTPTRAVSNQMMVVKMGSVKLEILSSTRAIRLKNGQYQIIDSDSPFSTELAGVAYDFTHKSYLFITGEISFKLLGGSDIASLPGNLASKSTLIIKPNIYVIETNTPLDTVNTYNLLKSAAGVDWVEIYSTRGAH